MDDAMNGFARLAASNGINGAGMLNGLGGGTNELLGVAMKALPMFMERMEQGSANAAQQKESFTALRKQLHALRQDHGEMIQNLGELMQSHTEVLKELRQMRKLQASVLQHLARIRLVDSSSDSADFGDEDPDEFDHAPQQPRHRLRSR